VDDAERQHLQRRLEESERARRRWKFVALATPVLAVLFGLALVNAVTTSLTLREVVRQEREQRERAVQAEQEASRQLYLAQLRAAQAELTRVQVEEGASKQP